jgi:hypothetical protein
MRTPHNLLLFAIVTTTLLSCKQRTEKTTASKKPMPIDVIREYYNKVEKLKLPLKWDAFIDSRLGSKGISINDTLTFTSDINPLTLLGAFPDTSKYFGFLLAHHGDDIGPVIATFNKKGKKVSLGREFGYGCGGSDCWYICEYTDFVVNKNLSFQSTTKSYTKECEEDTDKMDTTIVEFRITEVHGQISPNGMIKVGKAKDVESKTWPYNSPENPMRKHK